MIGMVVCINGVDDGGALKCGIMKKGAASTRPAASFIQSKKEAPSKANAPRNGTKPQPSLRRGQYPHLENVPSSNASTPSAKPRIKATTTKAPPVSSQKPLTSIPVDSLQEPNLAGGNLSSTVSSLGTSSSDEEATTSTASGSDTGRSRRVAEETTPRKKPVGGGKRKAPCTPSCPSPAAAAEAGSLRSGHVQRALLLPHHFELAQNASFWDDHNVQVVVRARPISGKEAAKHDFSRCLRQDGPHAISWLGPPETRFNFDHVAGENISQEKLFNVVGLPIVENCIAGYNSCMFAYGQTGSGKTHTMLGDITGLGDKPSDNRGMTPRIFEYLFARIQKEEHDRQLEQLRFACKCSFLEIYNEQITDLLEPSSSNLQMREDSTKGVYVENLTEKVVTTVQDVIVLLLRGAANRKVASTNMNRESSRSHSVFTCSIESKWETNSLSNIRFGRLNLVDLAGSERQKSSGAEGDRLKEAASINKSLSTLGLVMMILVDIANGKQRHVPYRDSKLTFLLQDSLGGNSKTAIIATISPASCCSMETLSTLKFAQRAKFIQNNAVVNEDASGEMLALRREIQQLKEEVSRLRCQSISSLRRECRRDSNEFFRLSMTGKDLFDAADKRKDDEELKSKELLEKSKALEAVLAGALRREQVADTATKMLSTDIQKANKLIEEVRRADEVTETSSELEEHMLVTKLELENSRLSAQLQCYQSFFDAGEREMMAAEIQGLRDQVLELLDGKIAAERGSLSTTVTQGENYRVELETCRNDLTNCLEASSQLQRQVNDLQMLVNQLTEDCAGLKGICEQKQTRIDQLEIEQTNATTHAQAFQDSLQEVERLQSALREMKEEYVRMGKAKDEEMKVLYHDLAEGERALVEMGQEMDEILSEQWPQENPTRWSLEQSSSKGVDAEQEYFTSRASCKTDDIFGTSKLRKSLGVSPRLSILAAEKLKFEAKVAYLEQDHTRLQTENLAFQREVEAAKHKLDNEVTTVCSLHVELENKIQRIEELESLQLRMNELEATLEAKVAYLEQDHKRVQSENLAFQKEIKAVEQKLDNEVNLLASTHDELSSLHLELENKIERIAVLEKLQLQLERMNDLEATLKAKVAYLEQDHERIQSENLALQREIEAAQQKLDTEVGILVSTHDELRTKVSSLHVELENKIQRIEELEELQLQLERMNDLEVLLEAKVANLEQDHTRIQSEIEKEIEAAEQKLDDEVNLLTSTHEELRRTVSSLHVGLENKTQRIEELEDYVEKLQLELKRMNDHEATLLRERDEALQELQNDLDLKLEALQLSLQLSQDEMKNKDGELLKQERAKTRLQEELLVMTELLKNTQLEKDRLQEELASSVLDYHNTAQQKNETIRHLTDSAERLQTELQRKEDLLYGLEFDIRLLQEHAAEETDFKQDLLEANARVSELQAEVQVWSEEVKQLGAAKKEVEEQLARKTEAMKKVEEELVKSEAHVAVVVNESQVLSTRVLQLQGRVSSLEAELAEKMEYLSSLEKELMVTRVTSTRMTMECSHKAAAIQSLQDVVQNLSTERDDLRASIDGELLVSMMTDFSWQELNSELQSIQSSLHDEIQELTHHLADCEEANKSLKLELAEKLTEVISLKDEISIASGSSAEKLRSYKAENGALLKERHDLHNSISSLESQLITARASIDAVEEKIGTLQAENGAILKERDDLQTTISSFESQLITARASSEALEAKIGTLQAENGALLKETDDLQTTISSLIASSGAFNAALEEKIGTIQAENGALLKERDDLQSTISSLESQSEAKIGTLQVEVNEAKKVAEEKCSLEAQIEGLQVEKRTLEEDISCKTMSLAATSEELVSSKARILELEAEAVRKMDSISCKAQEIEAWKQKCCALESQLVTMTAQVAQQGGQLHSLEEQLDRAEAEALQLMVKANDATEEHELEHDIQTMKEARDRALEDVQALHEGLSKAHEASILETRNLETLISTLKLQNSTLEKQLDDLKKHEVQTIMEARDQALKDVQKLRKAQATHEASILESRNLETTLKHHNNSLGKQVEVVKLEADKLRQARDELEMELQGMKNCMAIQEASIFEKDEETRNLETLVSTLKHQNDTLEKQLEVMKLEADKLRQARDELKMELQGMKNRMATQEASILEKDEETRNLETLVSTLEQHNKTLEKQLEVVKLEADKLRQARDELEMELQGMKNRVATHEASVLEKDEETRNLEHHNNTLEKQLEVVKLEADKLRQARDELEMELQGMKNRMAMIQAVQSTGSRDVKGLQAANLDLQRRLEEKETEVSQLYKRMATLHSQVSRLDEMENELAHAHQELDDLHSKCEDKDAQLKTLKGLNKEAEKLTQDVMRDLHNFKLDINNYASLVNQQQSELISERARHSEKDDEISNLQTKLNQERQTWMQEMNHKQAEMVVARVLSEKMRVKNKTLAAEYKKLKADYIGKKKKLKMLEQELKELTAATRRVSMESDDFDEVQQFQALLAQANDSRHDSETDFDEVQQFQALLAQANDASQRSH